MEYAPTPRLMSAPPPIAHLPAGHIAVADFASPFEYELVELTYWTDRT
jgi:hypothetical protein